MSKNITTKEFIDNIFDFTANTDWKFKGNKPCIIDFYADWCQPCKIISPILNELYIEYGGKLDIFKLDVQTEGDVANVFGIKSIPSLLFIPAEGQPQMLQGALPKEAFQNAIKDVFGVE